MDFCIGAPHHGGWKVRCRLWDGEYKRAGIIVESIDYDFDDAVDIEFGSGSEVLRVDDLEGTDLKGLYSYLKALPVDAEIDVVGRVYDWSPEAYSSLMRYSFKVEKLGCSWCDQ